MRPFQILQPEGEPLPVLLSIPHCGTVFPDELIPAFKPHLINRPDDTDWFVHTLYDFAPAMGITVIHAVYHRWVIDLNRPPDNQPLYHDGRLITGLCPVTTFTGEPLYCDKRRAVPDNEVLYRLQHYYKPYHQQLQHLLQELKTRFGTVLLWDCHSIRHYVPTIHPEPFPFLILGNAGGTTASPGLIEIALKSLEKSGLAVSHNYPFSGGHITRWYGRPSENQHALQLEMSKLVYMDDSEKQYHQQRAGKIRQVLRTTLLRLAECLMKQ